MNEPKQKWPKKGKIVEALAIVRNFRDACKLQLDLGYPFKVAFPSKIHLNKILSIQYIERSIVENVYGIGLSREIYTYIPYIKNYIKFTQELEAQDFKDVAVNQ